MHQYIFKNVCFIRTWVYLSPVSPLGPSRTLLGVTLLRYCRVPGALESAGAGGGQHALPDLGPCPAAAGPAALGPVRPGGPVRAGVRAARPLLSRLAAAAQAATAPAERTLTLAVPSVADPDPGSGIRCLLDPWIRDPVSGRGKKSGSGSGIRDEQPGSYFLELRNNFLG
jgi:hypothetical protein